jgi:hypothetical protein
MTRKCVGVFVLLLVAMAAGTVASAQEKGNIGVNLGYPSVGVTWHVTETVAVRPELTFSIGSSSTTAGSGVDGSESDAWAIGFGVSGLFYVAEWDSVKGYVVPRFAMTRSSADGLSTIEGSKIETTSRSYDLSLSAGAQYALSARISVFGELGLNYTKRHSESDGVASFLLDSDSWAFGPRTAIGLIVYF